MMKDSNKEFENSLIDDTRENHAEKAYVGFINKTLMTKAFKVAHERASQTRTQGRTCLGPSRL